jgi:hypothetical protein
MKFIVRIPELDSALYDGEGNETRQELFHIIRKLERSGRLAYGGLLADDRGGFLLMEGESCSEHEALLNSIFDPSRYTVESHLILPFENLTTLLDQIPAPKSNKASRPVVG